MRKFVVSFVATSGLLLATLAFASFAPPGGAVARDLGPGPGCKGLLDAATHASPHAAGLQRQVGRCTDEVPK